MADHPPHSYGRFPTQQPHPHFAHQSSPPNPQPPYFGTPQISGVVVNNYATANNSYEYNANRIPGLGLGGTAAPLPPASRTENNSLWHMPLQAPVSMSNFQQPGRGNYSLGARSLPVSSQQPAAGGLEEGELSEGEFEDLYEPKDPNQIVASAANMSLRPSGVPDDRPGSVGDADGSSIYDAVSPQGEVTVNSTSTSLPAADQEYSPHEDWEPAYPERDRSGSYSPYLSPREVQRKASISKAMPREARLPEFQHGPESFSNITTSSTQQPGRPFPPPSGVAAVPNPRSVAHPTEASTTGTPFRSVSEAKKKAQEAILGLWPLKVRYQDYIEEGLDATVMKKLFTDLGLDTSVPKPPVKVQKAAGGDGPVIPKSAGIPVKDTSASQQITKPPQNTSQPPTASITTVSEVTLPDRTQSNGKGDEVKPAGKTAAEERKDKIARKLAAKAQKSTVTTGQPSTTAVPAPVSSAPASEPKPLSASPAKPKGKTRAENNAILQKKLAALKKIQEKAAASKSSPSQNDVPVPVSSGAGTTSATTATPESNNSADAVPKSTPATSVLPSLENRPVSADIQSNSKDGSIPGLFLSSQPSQSSSRILKRPVASDFDNYPPREAPPKRTRTMETLIIDVSDDEDVEMDIGSPADEPSSPTDIINSSARKTPLGAFPPLTDTTNWRQRSSPVSNSAPTPPVHGAKLDLLHKRIEETKRMIAEAEAKKASKKPGTPQSPQAQNPLVLESITLPKLVEARKLRSSPNVDRRDRIASYELPRLEASLKEKQDRLKLIVAQATQLELEVQAGLDERQKLTSEMETLPDAPEEESTGSDSQSSAISHVAVDEAGVSGSSIKSPCQSEKQANSSQDQPQSIVHEDQNNTSHNGGLVPQAIEDNTRLDFLMSGCGSPSHNENMPAPSSMPQSPTYSVKEPEPELKIHDDSMGNNMTEGCVEGEAASSAMNESTNAPSGGLGEDSSEADISMQTSAADLSESDDDSYEPSPAQISDPHDTKGHGPRIEEAVDEVPDEPNPTHAVSEQAMHEREASRGEDNQDTVTPLEDLLSYQSPLGYFRAYRFHPKYFDKVQGGLKSMTYSSRIDPMRPLCPDVLAGEQCPRGNACEFQHFESMVLPDAEIITQLGSADMFTGETKGRFIEGLKKVLNDLKANKVRDFDRITRAIVKHRQDFLNDKTKVLPLDAGTSQATS